MVNVHRWPNARTVGEGRSRRWRSTGFSKCKQMAIHSRFPRRGDWARRRTGNRNNWFSNCYHVFSCNPRCRLGPAAVFFLLASLCSIRVEMVANWKKCRHAQLKDTINNLLKDAAAPTNFWAHPEIEPLRALDAESPGYLEGRRFDRVSHFNDAGRASRNFRVIFDKLTGDWRGPPLNRSLFARKLPAPLRGQSRG